MKQLIFTKTLLFLFVIVFVTAFEKVFGEANVLIGVTTVIAFLLYLERDLTADFWTNLLVLLGLNLLQGVFGFVASLNMWLAIPFNFLAMFIVGYFFSVNLKKSLCIAFGLQYLFILTMPIPGGELPLRLTSLAFGPFMIMTAQWVLNRDRLARAGNRLLAEMAALFIEKIESARAGRDWSAAADIEATLRELRKMICFRRKKGCSLPAEGRLMLGISVCMEKLNFLLDRLAFQNNKMEYLDLFAHEFSSIRKIILSGKTTPLPKRQKAADSEKSRDFYACEIIGTFDILYKQLRELYHDDPLQLKKAGRISAASEDLIARRNFLIRFNRDSVRFTYGVRLGFVIVLASFITDYYTLANGRWMIFTIFSVTQPYFELARARFGERITGTLLGAALVFVLFGIFTEHYTRLMIILFFGYLNSYAVTYRSLVITVTVISLGTAALAAQMSAVIVERIGYVAAGIGLGMIANYWILPHDTAKDVGILIRARRDLTQYLLKALRRYLAAGSGAHDIENLFASASFLEEYLLFNHEITERDSIPDFLAKARIVDNGAYSIFLWSRQSQISGGIRRLTRAGIHRLLTHDSESGAVANALKMVKKEGRAGWAGKERIILGNLLLIAENIDFTALQSKPGH